MTKADAKKGQQVVVHPRNRWSQTTMSRLTTGVITSTAITGAFVQLHLVPQSAPPRTYNPPKVKIPYDDLELDTHPMIVDTRDAWGHFLHARKLLIDELMGEPPDRLGGATAKHAQVAKQLSMDPLQVRLIHMTDVAPTRLGSRKPKA